VTTASGATQSAPFTQSLDQVPPVDLSVYTVRLLATAARTGGSLGFLEATFPVGSGVAMHIHHTEDEVVFVLEGEFLFVVEESRVEAGPGTFVFVPRGIPHGFKSVGRVPGRYLESFIPGGFEAWFAAPDPRTAAEYGLEVVGPMPEEGH
jgi:mannose-6-phosphate isomerase-like protein (cupin superfamily)